MRLLDCAPRLPRASESLPIKHGSIQVQSQFEFTLHRLLLANQILIMSITVIPVKAWMMSYRWRCILVGNWYSFSDHARQIHFSTARFLVGHPNSGHMHTLT